MIGALIINKEMPTTDETVLNENLKKTPQEQKITSKD